MTSERPGPKQPGTRGQVAPRPIYRASGLVAGLVFGFALFWLWDRVLLWKRTSLLAMMLALHTAATDAESAV